MNNDDNLQEALSELKGPLKQILENEIAAGNQVVEVAHQWPMSGINIWLKEPLTDKYVKQYPSLEYHYRADPKYWLEDYTDNDIEAMLAATC